MKLFEISWDFGVVYVVAESFEEALIKYEKVFPDGRDVTEIKLISRNVFL